MPTLRYTYLLLLYLVSINVYAKPPSTLYFLADTTVLHHPKSIEASRSLHDIEFLSSDTTKATKRFSEWKLLHMDDVYVVAPIISKEMYRFLVDTLGIEPMSLDSCLRYPNWENMYSLIFHVRADYYEQNYRAISELVKAEYRSPFPIYRPGYKYEYYKVLVEIPKEFYIDSIRSGSILIKIIK